MSTINQALQPEAKEPILTYRLVVLLLTVITAGASQGLLLPLLTILLERGGVPDHVNGLNSMALYIGTFSTMFFIERPVRRFGFRTVMVGGITLITAATLLFPLTAGSFTAGSLTMGSLVAWFALRIVVGIGDSGLHFVSQLWIVSQAPSQHRGKFISLYGMSYGVGFSIGPLGINLLHFGDWTPFLVSAALYTIILIFVLKLPRDHPEPRQSDEAAGISRYKSIYRIAWYALLPAMLYGIMEASMNSSFPLYGFKIGLDREAISGLLPVLGIGGLLLQLPLGIWSDRIGRLPVLVGSGIGGGLLFLAVPLAGANVWLTGLIFMAAGGLVGSFFSLGLAYAADMLPRHMLPGANVMASIHFSIGSLAGPVISGYGLRYISASSVFYLLGGAFLLYGLAGIITRGGAASRESSSEVAS